MSDKEREDGILFNSLDTTNVRRNFAAWVIRLVARENFAVLEVPVVVPEVCSDGVVRSPEEYVLFTSGKSVEEHIQAIREFNQIFDPYTVEIVYNGSFYRIMPASISEKTQATLHEHVNLELDDLVPEEQQQQS